PGSRTRVSAAGGTFDDPSQIRVDRHVWTRSAHPWVSVPAEQPSAQDRLDGSGGLISARTSSSIEYRFGESLSVNADLTLVHCPGHFPGSTVLPWRSGADGLGALMSGDSIQVSTPDEDCI